MTTLDSSLTKPLYISCENTLETLVKVYYSLRYINNRPTLDTLEIKMT